MWNHMGEGIMGGGWLMGAGWVIPLGIVGLVVWFALQAHAKGRGAGQGEPALEVLKRRYASGEISKEAFEAMRRDIE